MTSDRVTWGEFAENPVLKAWLLESPENLAKFFAELAKAIEEKADSRPMEERLRGARAWVWEVGKPNKDWDGPHDDPYIEGPKIAGAYPDLWVRCGEDVNGAYCGERMGRFWRTPWGTYGEVRWPVSHARTMYQLSLAMRERADGDAEGFASYAEHIAGEPVIMPVLVEAAVADGNGVILGCKRRHGMALVPTGILLTEIGSNRRKLHLRPSEWRGEWKSQDGTE